MPDWLKNLFDWSKIPTHYFLAFAIASGFTLFAQPDFLESLGLSFWREEGKFYSGTVFILSICLAVCGYSATFVAWVNKRYLMFRSQWAAQRRLKYLSPEEQNLLAGYFKENTRTRKFDVEDGVVAGLVHADIIYAAVSQANEYRFPFNIRNWVWIYLKKNPHLIGVTHDLLQKKP